MKYIYLARSVVLMTSCFSGFAAEQAERSAAVPESLPEEFQFLTDKSLGHFPIFTRDIVKWPDKAKVSRGRLDRSNALVSAGISNTVLWLERVLQPNWVPSLGECYSLRILALKGDIQGNDAVRLRYKLNDTRIQVVSTSSVINLLIQDAAPSKKRAAHSQVEALCYISGKIEQYLRHSDEIKSLSSRLVKEQGPGFKGSPDIRPETCQDWWGLVAWWTDGDVVLFSIGKAERGPLAPTLKANWLSSSP